MTWFYAAGGQQNGPVEESRLQELYRTGVINEQTLVWREGLANWRPYVEAIGGAAPALQRYGGFWIRFLGRIIDSIILGVARWIIFLPFGFGFAGFTRMTGPFGGEPDLTVLPALFGAMAMVAVLSVGLGLVYEVYFLTSRGATPGKMALGLKVVRADGGPISVGLAVGRYFAYVLSGLTIGIGFIIAGFDSQKRSLHDHICSTRVVRISS